MAHAPAFFSVGQTKTGSMDSRSGLGRSGAITHRLQRRQLQRLHRGVSAVGHRRLTQDGFMVAAVLASGDDPRVLRSILDEATIGQAVTRSELEDAFLRFIADPGLPLPPG